MRDLDTLGDERLVIAAAGDEAVRVCVVHPQFGRIATVRLDRGQAGDLATVLRELGSNGWADAA